MFGRRFSNLTDLPRQLIDLDQLRQISGPEVGAFHHQARPYVDCSIGLPRLQQHTPELKPGLAWIGIDIHLPLIRQRRLLQVRILLQDQACLVVGAELVMHIWMIWEVLDDLLEPAPDLTTPNHEMPHRKVIRRGGILGVHQRNAPELLERLRPSFFLGQQGERPTVPGLGKTPILLQRL